MFVGPDFLRGDTLPPVAIIGSGPAGLTLAADLAARQIPTLVLEAGHEDYEPDVQDAYGGQVTGDPYFHLDLTRLRMFGGSSNHWTGWCRPLDAWDFEAVPELDIPGWPISRADLDPFAQKTQDILEIDHQPDVPLEDGLFEAHFSFSPPVRFSEKYRPVISTSPYLHVALGTAVTVLKTEDGQITELEALDANGEPLRLSPAIVVLACGGIENTRLLLWSNQRSPQRVVAEASTLGKYWMEHPHADVGMAFQRHPLHRAEENGAGFFSIGLTPETLMRHGALNAAVRIQYPWPLTSFDSQIEQRLCGYDPELLDVVNRLAGSRGECGRQLVRLVWEQTPDAFNRIELSESERDSLGIPRTHLMWRKTAQDYRTARIAFELVGAHMARSGKGLLKADPHLIAMGGYPDSFEPGGHHHMGGTRMAETARQGIVDANLKIHGLSNGYIAGSSVFPRGGHANPTYTIVQLSLRLAEHLSAQLRR